MQFKLKYIMKFIPMGLTLVLVLTIIFFTRKDEDKSSKKEVNNLTDIELGMSKETLIPSLDNLGIPIILYKENGCYHGYSPSSKVPYDFNLLKLTFNHDGELTYANINKGNESINIGKQPYILEQ